MSSRRPSIDGFIPRRTSNPSQQSDGSHGLQISSASREGLTRPGSAEEGEARHNALRPEKKGGLTRADLDESLNSVGGDDSDNQHRHRRKFRRKRIKQVVIFLVVVFLLITAYIGVRALIASGNIFKGDLLGLVQAAPLKEDSNGRSNILVFGTSEDSQSHQESGAGALLTDSMMVVSINQNKKDAYMVSIPRDLWVDYDATCLAGYQGKINALYECHSDGGEKEDTGRTALRKKVGEVLGMDVQYYAQVNYSVVKEAVDAVGGVSVNIESDDPRGVYDPNFDWQCGNTCNMVKYPNGPTGNMDGEHALALARARNAAGGYGLSGGNFDREQYQQKIIKALREKAVSAGTIANVGKVTSLIDAFGSNLRTNFETKEIRTLMNLGNDIPSDQINSINLTDADPAVVTTGNVGGQSIVRAISGLLDYSSIQSYVKKQISSDPVTREGAIIGVYNGTSTSGVAQSVANKLTQIGLSVDAGAIGNAPDGTYAAYEVYDLTDDKAATRKKLEGLYNVTAKTTAPPVNVTGIDFVVIVGKVPTSQQ